MRGDGFEVLDDFVVARQLAVGADFEAEIILGGLKGLGVEGGGEDNRRQNSRESDHGDIINGRPHDHRRASRPFEARP